MGVEGIYTRNTGRLIRIAVFYDGGYLQEVSNYYKFQHERRSRISLQGLHRFIRHMVAERENVPESCCQIVEAHYFRGRFPAEEAEKAGKLKDDRIWDDVLIACGIVAHYLPVDMRGEKPRERGIDLWLSLEAFDLAVHKGFDVIGLVACDGDYVPLIRKLNGLGIRSMLLAWDFEYVYDGRAYETRTSQRLIEECSYALFMSDIIDDRSRRGDAVINQIFTS